MKAREFLSEASGKLAQAGSIPGTASNTLPMVLSIPYLRGFDSYMQYRYSMALAAARAMQQGLISQEQFDQESAFAENMIHVLYTPQELETVELAAKLMGAPVQHISSARSQEPESTNRVSPVPARRPNRYGV
jgi:hypothetical protein